MNKRYLNNYFTNKKSQILLELKYIELLIISFSKYKGKRFFNKGIKENESDLNEILFIKLLIKIIYNNFIFYFKGATYNSGECHNINNQGNKSIFRNILIFFFNSIYTKNKFIKYLI